jgi:hypothetical protein
MVVDGMGLVLQDMYTQHLVANLAKYMKQDNTR